MGRDSYDENAKQRQAPKASRQSGPRARSSGPNGLIKPPTIGGASGNGSKRPSNPRSSSDPKSRASSQAAPAGSNRSFSKLARDRMANASRSISRGIQQIGESFSRAVRDAGRMDTSSRGIPRPHISIPPQVMATLQESQPYRRSRARVIAAKWRRRRIKPNTIGYAAIIAVLSIVLLVVVIAGGLGGSYGVNYYNDHRAQVAGIYNLKNGSSTIIYDRNGKTLYVAKSDNTSFNAYVPLEQISPLLITATLDTEDHSFYSNIGIDFYRTLGALAANAKSGDLTGQGGSTITQQLVKNIVLKDRNKSYLRKVNEWVLAYGVTLNYTKKQILEMYLNSIDYGNQNQGIEIAARRYFGLDEKKDAEGKIIAEANQQLSLGQISLLVGLPNAPSTFLPTQFSCDKASCDESIWDKPCLSDLHNIDVCVPNPNYDASIGANGHEWLDYRRSVSILRGMLRYGHITQAQMNQAVAEVHDTLVNHKVYNNAYHHDDTQTVNNGKLAPAFVDWVLKQLTNDFGIQDVERAGLRVYTTLDYTLQNYAEDRIHYYMLKTHDIRWKKYCPGGRCTNLPPLSVSGGAFNAALVAEDQHTGDILALVGTADYGSPNKKIAGFIDMSGASNNVARSMGSSTKALVYATAFQMGWTPATVLQDQPICWDDAQTADPNADPNAPPEKSHSPSAPACDGWYVPQNYTLGSFSGRAPVRLMLANSLNVPATETMSFVGSKPDVAQNYITMTQRLGITTQQPGLMGVSTALGTQPIPLIQMTGAFATFGNNGARVPQRSILRIETADGTVLYKAPAQQKAEQVLSPQANYMLTSVLSDNEARAADFGWDNPLYFPDFPVAAKTGTSQGTIGPKDIITMGYSPWLALGVWMGNTDNSDMQHIAGITGAGFIFGDVMQYAHDTYKWPKVAGFPIPSELARASFNCVTGMAPYSDKPDTDCTFNPVTTGSTNLWDGYNFGNGVSHHLNEDWYIQGQAPVQS